MTRRQLFPALAAALAIPLLKRFDKPIRTPGNPTMEINGDLVVRGKIIEEPRKKRDPGAVMEVWDSLKSRPGIWFHRPEDRM